MNKNSSKFFKGNSTSAEKYIRVTTTVNANGDTIVRQQTRYNTDLRKYIGAFEISGNTWRVYHDAGHTDLNATSGALTHRYYVRDYLGSTRAVVDEDGNVLQSTAYYPSGVPLTPNSLTPQTIKLHTGKDFFDLQGIKVANPSNGIFIKVQGEKASKELIK